MRRSEASSRKRRPTAIILGLLVAFVVVTVGSFVLSQGGGGTGRVDSGSAASKKRSSTAATTTTTTRPPIDYTVKQGDTLTAVAKYFGVSKTAILDANQIPDPDHLVPGQMFQIPSPTPVNLVIRPAKARTGGSVEIHLTGAQPDELVTFLIVSPVGMYSGPPHNPDAKGSITTTYRLGIADPPGNYAVAARGDQVTEADATFRVVAATP